MFPNKLGNMSKKTRTRLSVDRDCERYDSIIKVETGLRRNICGDRLGFDSSTEGVFSAHHYWAFSCLRRASLGALFGHGAGKSVTTVGHIEGLTLVSLTNIDPSDGVVRCGQHSMWCTPARVDSTNVAPVGRQRFVHRAKFQSWETFSFSDAQYSAM